MKKFLLFLSCFLTTWCSVQAANPQINSVTYNESSSTFSVSYTSNSSNNALMMVCKATGPVGSNVKLNASPATVDLPITARAGEYNLVLFSNGSPCYEKKNIIVTKYGHINSAKASSTSSVTINYSMFHAETSSYPDKSYLKIVGVGTHKITNVKNGSYTWTGLKLTEGNTYTCEIWVDDKKFDSRTFTVPITQPVTGKINSVAASSTSKVTVNYTLTNAKTNNCYLKIVGVNNTTHKISNVNNGSYTWTGLNLAPGQYTCEMYGDGKRLDTKSFTVTSPDMVKLTPMGGNRLKIDFTLSSTGYVKFMVHTYSMSGGQGQSKPVDYGQCDTYAGTIVVDVPYYSGYVGYAVELIKNGTSVNGASVTAYNR